MGAKLQTEEGRVIHARRSFRQFLLRGLANVRGEFTLVALTHDFLKLWRAGIAPAG